MHTGIKIALILALMLIAMRLSTVLSNRLFSVISSRINDPEYRKRSETLTVIIRYILKIAIIIVAFMITLRQLGIEIGPILAAAGIVGLAVSFGAQSLVKDIIAGFFILL